MMKNAFAENDVKTLVRKWQNLARRNCQMHGLVDIMIPCKLAGNIDTSGGKVKCRHRSATFCQQHTHLSKTAAEFQHSLPFERTEVFGYPLHDCQLVSVTLEVPILHGKLRNVVFFTRSVVPFRPFHAVGFSELGVCVLPHHTTPSKRDDLTGCDEMAKRHDGLRLSIFYIIPELLEQP